MSAESSHAASQPNRVSPEHVADQQAVAGALWAEALRHTEGDADMRKFIRDAEITMRNPAVYTRGDFDLQGLPETLKGRWANLLKVGDGLAAVSGINDSDWQPESNSLSKIQHRMVSGDMNPAFKGTLADVIAESSQLFAESTAYIPGDTGYFAGNAQAMATRFAVLPRN